MSAERCETCRFRRGAVSEWDGYANCHRFPPIETKKSGGDVAVWPRTAGHAWCGEWAARDDSTIPVYEGD